MTEEAALFLHEEALLLALRDEEGTVPMGTQYEYALAGAMLAELTLVGAVNVRREGKKALVEPHTRSAPAHPLLEEMLARIQTGKAQPPEHWIREFAHMGDLKHRVAQPLCERGVLREEQGRVLLMFSRTTYPEANPEPERQLLERLRASIFEDDDQLDARTVLLIALANSTGLLELVFDRKELKARKQRIEAIVVGESLAEEARAAMQATQDMVLALQTAVLVACIVPTIVTS